MLNKVKQTRAKLNTREEKSKTTENVRVSQLAHFPYLVKTNTGEYHSYVQSGYEKAPT